MSDKYQMVINESLFKYFEIITAKYTPKGVSVLCIYASIFLSRENKNKKTFRADNEYVRGRANLGRDSFLAVKKALIDAGAIKQLERRNRKTGKMYYMISIPFLLKNNEATAYGFSVPGKPATAYGFSVPGPPTGFQYSNIYTKGNLKTNKLKKIKLHSSNSVEGSSALNKKTKNLPKQKIKTKNLPDRKYLNLARRHLKLQMKKRPTGTKTYQDKSNFEKTVIAGANQYRILTERHKYNFSEMTKAVLWCIQNQGKETSQSFWGMQIISPTTISKKITDGRKKIDCVLEEYQEKGIEKTIKLPFKDVDYEKRFINLFKQLDGSALNTLSKGIKTIYEWYDMVPDDLKQGRHDFKSLIVSREHAPVAYTEWLKDHSLFQGEVPPSVVSAKNGMFNKYIAYLNKEQSLHKGIPYAN